METEQRGEPIGDELFDGVERLRRQLQLGVPADEGADHEVGALVRECVSLCGEILAWRPESSSEQSSPPPSHAESPTASPAEKLLVSLRRELSERYREEAPGDVRTWLETWQAKVEGALLERSLPWIRRSSEEVQAWEAMWQAALSRRKPLSLWGRIRTFRLARRAQDVERRVAGLGASLAGVKVRCEQFVAETKLLAGMVSVFLKVHSGEQGQECRNLVRVLELECEREVERQLRKRYEECAGTLRQLREQHRSLVEARQKISAERGKLEQRKNVRMLEAWTSGSSDPRALIARATEHQILTAWGDVEKRIAREQALVREASRKERRLEGEFERLMGVIRDYQEAAQAEESGDDTARRGASPTQVAARGRGAGPCH